LTDFKEDAVRNSEIDKSEREKLNRIIDDQSVLMREGNKRESELDRKIMHIEEDLDRKSRISEDLRVEIQKLHSDLDQQRSNFNQQERSKNDLILNLEDLKFDIQSKSDQLANE
jgi:chromosome segregation ATPase